MSRNIFWLSCFLGLGVCVQAGTYSYDQPIEETRIKRQTEMEAFKTEGRDAGTSSVPVTVFRLLQTYLAPSRSSNVEEAEVQSDDQVAGTETVSPRPIAQFASNAASTVSNAVQTVIRYISPVLMVAFPFLIPLLIGGGAAAARNFDFDALNRIDWGGFGEFAGRVHDSIQEFRDAWDDEEYY